MQEIPLVSVVIATYKTPENYLRTALDSLINQSWSHLEILIVDDSPVSDLEKFVLTFKDHRLQYIHREISLGVAENHWQAFKVCRGKYISVLNHDDSFDRFFIEKMVVELERNSQLALAFCDHWIMDSNGNIDYEETDRNSHHWKRSHLHSGIHQPFDKLLIDQSIPMVMGTVFRQDLLPTKFPDNAGPAYDLWLTYLLCKSRKGSFYIPERLSYWRAHPQNITSQGGWNWSYGTALCWEAVSYDPCMNSIKRKAKVKSAASFASCAMMEKKRGNIQQAWKWIVKALLYHFSFRNICIFVYVLLPLSISKYLKLITNHMKRITKS